MKYCADLFSRVILKTTKKHTPRNDTRQSDKDNTCLARSAQDLSPYIVYMEDDKAIQFRPYHNGIKFLMIKTLSIVLQKKMT